MKFTDDFMKKSLAHFGENYEYPVFASVYCKSGLFSRYRAQTGFVAVTDDDRLLVVEYLSLGISEKEYIFSAEDIVSLKIKKAALMSVYTIKSVFKINRRTVKLNIAVSLKVSGGDFPEQTKNAENFIETLKNWLKYIKE